MPIFAPPPPSPSLQPSRPPNILEGVQSMVQRRMQMLTATSHDV